MVLVTGATGFVGRSAVRALVQARRDVRCLVRATSDTTILDEMGVGKTVGDVREPSSLSAALSGAEAVVHLVAVIRQRGEATYERVNLEGTRHLLRAAKEASVRRIVFMSNLGVGPDPKLAFLYSKWRAEQEVAASGLDYTILRSGLIFGQGDEFVTTLADLVRRSPTGFVKLAPVVPIIGPGTTRLQLVWVEDVARCIVAALDDASASGETIEIAGPEQFTYEELVDIVIEKLGVRRWKLHLPLPLMRPAVWAMERVLPRPPVTLDQLRMLDVDNVTDVDAIERRFGFKPKTLREGLDYLDML